MRREKDEQMRRENEQQMKLQRLIEEEEKREQEMALRKSSLQRQNQDISYHKPQEHYPKPRYEPDDELLLEHTDPKKYPEYEKAPVASRNVPQSRPAPEKRFYLEQKNPPEEREYKKKLEAFKSPSRHLAGVTEIETLRGVLTEAKAESITQLSQNSTNLAEEEALSLRNKTLEDVVTRQQMLLTKNEMELIKKVEEEKMLDAEIAKLQLELSVVEKRIEDTQSNLKNDSSRNYAENSPYLMQNRLLAEEIAKRNLEIEKYKLAHMDLLTQWQNSIEREQPAYSNQVSRREEPSSYQAYQEPYSQSYTQLPVKDYSYSGDYLQRSNRLSNTNRYNY